MFVNSAATEVLPQANRKRTVHIEGNPDSPPLFVGNTAGVTAGTGRLVNPVDGLDYELGPDKILYGVTLGPFGTEMYGTVEDSVDEGRFSDDGSGTDGALGSGGGAS